MEVPDWVLYRVVGSKPEDWRLHREGWLNTSMAMQRVNPGVAGVYVSQHGELEVIQVTEFSLPAKPAPRTCPTMYVNIVERDVTQAELDLLTDEIQKAVMQALQTTATHLPHTDSVPVWCTKAFEEAYRRVMAEVTVTMEGEVK